MRRLLFVIALAAPLAGAAGFTLEQVMSAPFPYDLVASHTSGKVAWVLNERGARNIWIASPPDYKGARLTAYKDDDGMDVGQLEWTPDGRAVVYTRGGDLEFLGRPDPNPAVITTGVEQDIWMAAPGSAPRKLGQGHSPAVSPKGDIVAFLKAGEIWSAPLNGGGKAAQLIMARSGATASQLVWSPDGSKLAFVSDRGDHSFIAVYDVASKALTYLDPTVDRDRNPVWSRDGRRIAFIRTLAGREFGRGARRSGTPWTIRVATVADGAGHEIWKAEDGPGSVFHQMVAGQQMFWMAGDRIVFPWERDGWLHLYSISVQGGAATPLTPGEFEVEHVACSPDAKELIFSSNQGDIDRRHLWRVSAAEGPPRPVTSGEELEWSPVVAGDGIAFLHADARRPARAAIQLRGATRDLAPDSIPASFPTDSLVVPQQVIYKATDGMPIHGQLFLPAGRAGERHPALVFMHGGSRRQMLLGWHYMDYYNNAYAMNQYLANQGYVVLSINYRSGIGYGMEFREALNYGATGASEYQDVVGAGQYLKSRPDVDPAHIGLWGGSYGGYLTALGLARDSGLFAAGVDFHGVHDWSNMGRGGNPNTAVPGRAGAAAQAGEGGRGGAADATRVAFQSSPMASVASWKSPVLLIHADDDRNVNFGQTVMLVEALRRQNVYFEQLIIPDEIHGFLRHTSWVRAYSAAADFFKRKL
jgi:dipeptidyl aminopeptidase/acylaminoacyl peptidase